MKVLKLALLVCFAMALGLFFQDPRPVTGQGGAPTEAPTGFDNLTNGMVDQATFDADLEVFSERESIADGLGPVFNAQACVECHQSPVAGGISQVTEMRAGHFNGANFVSHPGGTLINDRAIDSDLQERVLGGNEVRTFRSGR